MTTEPKDSNIARAMASKMADAAMDAMREVALKETCDNHEISMALMTALTSSLAGVISGTLPTRHHESCIDTLCKTLRHALKMLNPSH